MNIVRRERKGGGEERYTLNLTFFLRKYTSRNIFKISYLIIGLHIFLQKRIWNFFSPAKDSNPRDAYRLRSISRLFRSEQNLRWATFGKSKKIDLSLTIYENVRHWQFDKLDPKHVPCTSPVLPFDSPVLHFQRCGIRFSTFLYMYRVARVCDASF